MLVIISFRTINIVVSCITFNYINSSSTNKSIIAWASNYIIHSFRTINIIISCLSCNYIISSKTHYNIILI